MCCVAVPLSRLFKGSKVVIDGYSIKGEGTVLADAPLHQDRVYWEVTVVKLPSTGKFSLGVSRRYGRSNVCTVVCIPPVGKL